jgi:hypothetical protein
MMSQPEDQLTSVTGEPPQLGGPTTAEHRMLAASKAARATASSLSNLESP